MLNWIVYLLAMGGMLYVAAIYSSVEFVLLFVVGIIWGVSSLLLLLYQRLHLTIQLRFPLPAAEPGKAVPIEVIVRNQGRIPSNRMQLTLLYQCAGRGRREKFRLNLFSETKGELVFANQIMGDSSGSYHFQKAVLKLYEPLKLLPMRKRIELHEQLDVMPPIYDTGVELSERIRHFQGESDVYDTSHSGDDASEMFRIREFRPGDKLKDIHWKLSAKEEEWMVRENSAPLSCAVVLFADFAGNRKIRRNRDAMLSVISGISFALIQEGCPHYVVWYKEKEKAIGRVRVDDEETLSLLLLSLLEEEMSDKKHDLQDLYQIQYKGESYISYICVNMELQVWVNGDEAGRIRDVSVEEDMAELLLQI